MKIVITAAGRGTRLLPFTKEIPKEMTPVFSKINSGNLTVRPILEVIYEQLYSAGGRDFTVIIDKKKDLIKRYFTIDKKILKYLDSKQTKNISKFHNHLKNSKINWVYQKKALGFGDAVKISEKYVKDEVALNDGDEVALIPPVQGG